jgi:hypothetical protein
MTIENQDATLAASQQYRIEKQKPRYPLDELVEWVKRREE